MAGRLVHFELPADDTARARDFWSSLFGWSFRGWDGPIEYHMTEGVDPGGAIYLADGDERGPIVYFDVDDMDAAIGRVRELGGEADDKQEIPGFGHYAYCNDTEGNRFGLYQAG